MKKNEIQVFKTILENRKKTILENLQSNSKEIEALHNSVPSDSVDFSVIETGSQIDFAISANLKQEFRRNRRFFRKNQRWHLWNMRILR